jgi:hypothetical protein
LYLQLVIQMQAMISDGSSSLGIFKKPTQVLGFIKQALDTTSSTSDSSSSGENKKKERPHLDGFKLSRLSVVDNDEAGEPSDAEDSDDDLPDSERLTANDEMTETAINLLLSVLEGKEPPINLDSCVKAQFYYIRQLTKTCRLELSLS